MAGSPSGIAPGESLRAHVLISALTLEKKTRDRQTDGRTDAWQLLYAFTPAYKLKRKRKIRTPIFNFLLTVKN